MHSSCINYATMLNWYRDNSYHRKEKYKRDMHRPSFPSEENKPVQRSCIFWKLFSLLILFYENNVEKLVGDMWGYSFNWLCQLLYNWIRMNMIFKSSCSQIFYKIAALKNFTKFKWKHLRPVAKSVKKRLQHRCFPVNFVKFLKTPFLQNTSGQLLLNFFIYFTVSLPPSELIENRLFPFLNMFYYKSHLSNVMNIMNFAIEKLH